MNRFLKIFSLAIFAIIAFSCTRELPLPVRNMKIVFDMPENFKPDVKYANREIILTSSSAVFKFTTDATGAAIIPELIPDEYTISTSWKMTGADYKSMISSTELIEDKAIVILKSTANRQQIFTSADIRLAVDKMVQKSLLISKVYYTGTKDNANKNYSVDSYVEVFNNSEETVYIDGKYLALAESMSPPAYPAKNDPNFIYARQICKFPGNGTDYPVLSGKSIVVATKNAKDHRTSASTSVDLSNADFEVKDVDGTGNPDIKALPIVSNSLSIKFFNMIASGGNAVFLFETTDDILLWPEVFAPGKTSGERFRKVPVSVVLDGAECLRNSSTTGPDINLKRFQDIVDAGFTFTNATSGNTHESLERKVSSVSEGRIILQDINNSTQDFVVLLDPTPRKYDKSGLIN